MSDISNIWDRINCETIMWFLSQKFSKNIIEVVEKIIIEEMNIIFCGEELREAINFRSIPNEKYKFTFNYIKVYEEGVIFDFSFHDLTQKMFRKFHLTIKPTPPQQKKKGASQAHIRFDYQKSENEFPISFDFKLPVSININTTAHTTIARNYGIDDKEFKEFISSCVVPGMNLLFTIFSLNDIMSEKQDYRQDYRQNYLSVDSELTSFQEDLVKIVGRDKVPSILSKNTYKFTGKSVFKHPNILIYEQNEIKINQDEIIAKEKAEEEAKRKAEEEAQRKAEEEAQKKAEEETKRKAEEEAKRKAEEEAKRKAEEETKRKAEEEKEWTTIPSKKQNKYKKKYLKYKQKYLQLKKLLEL